jgi:hypothetical protein
MGLSTLVHTIREVLDSLSGVIECKRNDGNTD